MLTCEPLSVSANVSEALSTSTTVNSAGRKIRRETMVLGVFEKFVFFSEHVVCPTF